jgi:hypothetical protein
VIVIHCEDHCAKCGSKLYAMTGESVVIWIAFFQALSPADIRPGAKIEPFCLSCPECDHKTTLKVRVVDGMRFKETDPDEDRARA